MNNSNGIEKILSEVSYKEDVTMPNKKLIGDIISQEREKLRKKEKARPHMIFARWSIAASIAIILTVALGFLFANTTFSTQSGKLAVTLPDGSNVEMQANSELHYNRLNWLLSRTLSLKGVATFAVTKGSKFTVETQVGNISVLGTKFLVDQEDDNLHVDCFEGRVNVATDDGDKIIGAGETVDYNSTDGMKLSKQKEKLPNYFIYNNISLKNVVEQLEKIYNVNIQPKGLYQGLQYTGEIATGDLEEALDVVFSSCGLGYSIDGSTIHLNQK